VAIAVKLAVVVLEHSSVPGCTRSRLIGPASMLGFGRAAVWRHYCGSYALLSSMPSGSSPALPLLFRCNHSGIGIARRSLFVGGGAKLYDGTRRGVGMITRMFVTCAPDRRHIANAVCRVRQTASGKASVFSALASCRLVSGRRISMRVDRGAKRARSCSGRRRGLHPTCAGDWCPDRRAGDARASTPHVQRFLAVRRLDRAGPGNYKRGRRWASLPVGGGTFLFASTLVLARKKSAALLPPLLARARVRREIMVAEIRHVCTTDVLDPIDGSAGRSTPRAFLPSLRIPLMYSAVLLLLALRSFFPCLPRFPR